MTEYKSIFLKKYFLKEYIKKLNIKVKHTITIVYNTEINKFVIMLKRKKKKKIKSKYGHKYNDSPGDLCKTL